MTDEHDEYDEYVAADVYRTFVELRPLFWWNAACLTEDLRTFFPGPGQSALVRRARDICFGCPVQRACFDFAYEGRIEYGVWGGCNKGSRFEWLSDGLSADEAWDNLLHERDAELAEDAENSVDTTDH